LDVAFLQQYIDPGLKPTKADTPDSLAKKEAERLNELYTIATAAAAIPRRLGSDASDEELAADARTGRRVAHVAQQCLQAWGVEVKPVTRNIAPHAAQVRWRHWLGEHLTYLDGRMRYIATWQYKTGGDEKWAKQALTRLINEQRWLEYAMRDAAN
jgi:hypothetical protein